MTRRVVALFQALAIRSQALRLSSVLYASQLGAPGEATLVNLHFDMLKIGVLEIFYSLLTSKSQHTGKDPIALMYISHRHASCTPKHISCTSPHVVYRKCQERCGRNIVCLPDVGIVAQCFYGPPRGLLRLHNCNVRQD